MSGVLPPARQTTGPGPARRLGASAPPSGPAEIIPLESLAMRTDPPGWPTASSGRGGGDRPVPGGIGGSGRLLAMTYIADPSRYDGKMTYRRSGRSGLQLPAVSLGLGQDLGGEGP